VHVQTHQGPRLRHVGALLWSCGPPPRPSPAARDSPHASWRGCRPIIATRPDAQRAIWSSDSTWEMP
jgi:hypothetical protein